MTSFRSGSLLAGALLLIFQAEAFTVSRNVEHRRQSTLRVPSKVRFGTRNVPVLEMKNMFAQDEEKSVKEAVWKGRRPSSKLHADRTVATDSIDLFKSVRDDSRDESAYNPLEQHQHGINVNTGVLVAGAATLGAIAVGTMGMDISLPNPADMLPAVEHFLQDPNSALQDVVHNVESMGPAGVLYFGAVYTVAEILAIPAIPLTASAGYLFGLGQGTAIVLASASIAAATSFVIGRTLLRSYVEGILEDYPEFAKIDKAIEKEGFKLMLLLRLSPIFPFALSNYLYGASSVRFWPYFFGTMLGFTPGTLAYVYTGEVGKALTLGGGQPWYVYAVAFAFVGGLMKTVADVATGVIQEMEEEA